MVDGINKHLYSPNKKYRLIFDNGLKIQEIVFKKQIPQVNTGITESGYLEKHLLGNDKRIINRTAKSLTFDGNGLTLYDKTVEICCIYTNRLFCHGTLICISWCLVMVGKWST